MKTIELKHLAPYGDKGCEYLSREGTKIPFDFEDLYDIQIAIKNGSKWQDNYRLILYPLSWLTKEIEHNGEKFVPMDRLKKIQDMPDLFFINNILWSHWAVVNQCIEWHFDVFN